MSTKRTPAAPHPTCPECGGKMVLVTDGMVGRTIAPPFYVPGRPLEVRMVSAPFGACTECEYCIRVVVGKPAKGHKK